MKTPFQNVRFNARNSKDPLHCTEFYTWLDEACMTLVHVRLYCSHQSMTSSTLAKIHYIVQLRNLYKCSTLSLLNFNHKTLWVLEFASAPTTRSWFHNDSFIGRQIYYLSWRSLDAVDGDEAAIPTLNDNEISISRQQFLYRPGNPGLPNKLGSRDPSPWFHDSLRGLHGTKKLSRRQPSTG